MFVYEIDAGEVVNTAIAHGKEPVNGTDVASQPSTAKVILDRNANLSLTKTADKQNASIGDTITYTFKVTNTGNSTLSDLSIEDMLEGASKEVVWDSAPVKLEPGQSATASMAYSITSDDLARGFVTNKAIAKAKSPSGIVTSNESEVKTEITALTLLRTDAPSSTSIISTGDNSPVRWFALIGLSFASVLGLALLRRKTR